MLYQNGGISVLKTFTKAEIDAWLQDNGYGDYKPFNPADPKNLGDALVNAAAFDNYELAEYLISLGADGSLALEFVESHAQEAEMCSDPDDKYHARFDREVAAYRKMAAFLRSHGIINKTTGCTPAEAWWITPLGQVKGFTNSKHIWEVWEAPEDFGLSLQELQAVYKKYGETCTVEKRAREEIMAGLMKKGYIRIRHNQGRHDDYVIQTWYFRDRIKDYITDWARHELKEGLKPNIWPNAVRLNIAEEWQNVSLEDLAERRL
jgi:hypothetical protein